MEHECFRFGSDDPLVADLGPFGAAAVSYVDNGYAVLPLAPGRKPPHKMLGEVGGVHLASRDRRAVWDWWRRDRTANVGVACGAVSRLIVFDLDVKGGEDGRAAFDEHLGRWIPQECVARTPSGGWHIWLRLPPGLAARGKQGLYPGVDVKADGGYVVAHSSVIPVSSAGHGDKAVSVDLPYTWETGCPCRAPELPDAAAVTEWIGAQPSRATRAGLEGAEPVDLGQLETEGLPMGSRNVGLYRALCKLYRVLGLHDEAEHQIDERLARIMARTDETDFGKREQDAIRGYARAYVAAQEEAGRPLLASFENWRKRWEGN